MTDDNIEMELNCTRCGNTFNYFDEGDSLYLSPKSPHDVYNFGLSDSGQLRDEPHGYLCQECTESYREWMGDTSDHGGNGE